MKHLHLTTRGTERAIALALPGKFAMVLDCWLQDLTHYAAMFASYSNTEQVRGYKTAMSSFSPLIDETSLDAKEHRNSLDYILNLHGKTREHGCPELLLQSRII